MGSEEVSTTMRMTRSLGDGKLASFSLSLLLQSRFYPLLSSLVSPLLSLSLLFLGVAGCSLAAQTRGVGVCVLSKCVPVFCLYIAPSAQCSCWYSSSAVSESLCLVPGTTCHQANLSFSIFVLSTSTKPSSSQHRIRRPSPVFKHHQFN